MHHLHEDIIEYILDNLDDCWWYEQNRNPRNLCRLACVSPTWLLTVRKRLYSFPKLYSYRQCHLLARTLEENPMIASLLRGLELQPMNRSFTDKDEENHSPTTCPAITQLLQSTRLRTLVLGGSLAIHAEILLRRIASPDTILKLMIYGRGRTSLTDGEQITNATLVWDYTLSSRFPALRFLKLRSSVIHIDDKHYIHDGDRGTGADDSPSECLLEELTLQSIKFANGSGPLCALLRAPASWRHLHSLTLDKTVFHQHDLENYLLVLGLAYSVMEQLTFKVCNTRIEDFSKMVKDIPPFRRLRFLTTCAQLIREEFTHITGNVESIDIRGPYDEDDVLRWVSLMDNDFFPNLRHFSIDESYTLGVDSDTGSLDSDTDLHEVINTTLKNTCKKHDIKLIVT